MLRGLRLLRLEIDRIDRQLVRQLAERFRIARQVADFKAQNGLPARIPTRIRAVMERRERLGRSLGIPRTSTAEIWKAIIEETCRLEESLVQLAHMAPEQGDAPMTKARKKAAAPKRKAKPAAKRPATVKKVARIKKTAKVKARKAVTKASKSGATRKAKPAPARRKATAKKKPVRTRTALPKQPVVAAPVVAPENVAPAPVIVHSVVVTEAVAQSIPAPLPAGDAPIAAETPPAPPEGLSDP